MNKKLLKLIYFISTRIIHSGWKKSSFYIYFLANSCDHLQTPLVLPIQLLFLINYLFLPLLWVSLEKATFFSFTTPTRVSRFRIFHFYCVKLFKPLDDCARDLVFLFLVTLAKQLLMCYIRKCWERNDLLGK